MFSFDSGAWPKTFEKQKLINTENNLAKTRAATNDYLIINQSGDHFWF